MFYAGGSVRTNVVAQGTSNNIRLRINIMCRSTCFLVYDMERIVSSRTGHVHDQYHPSVFPERDHSQSGKVTSVVA